MIRLSVSLVLATIAVLLSFSAFGTAITPQPQLKVIARVVAHAHHGTPLSNFISATDKL